MTGGQGRHHSFPSTPSFPSLTHSLLTTHYSLPFLNLDCGISRCAVSISICASALSNAASSPLLSTDSSSSFAYALCLIVGGNDDELHIAWPSYHALQCWSGWHWCHSGLHRARSRVHCVFLLVDHPGVFHPHGEADLGPRSPQAALRYIRSTDPLRNWHPSCRSRTNQLSRPISLLHYM